MEAAKKNKIWHKGGLWNEDDAGTSNTCIAQRKRVIPHSTMKNKTHSVIQCCNNTHQEAPHTGKQRSVWALDLGLVFTIDSAGNRALTDSGCVL